MIRNASKNNNLINSYFCLTSLQVLFSLGQSVIEENTTLSNTLAKIDREYMTPTVLKAPSALPNNVRVPDNTPVTPEVNTARSAPLKIAEGDLVNKNLFGTPVLPAGNISFIQYIKYWN